VGGRKCPFKRGTVVVRPSAKRLVSVRVRKAERRYPAGTSLVVMVTRVGTIGKYTKFVVRRGKAPGRFDSCVDYGRRAPRACP
jgi:hypothetical protein